MGPVTLSRPHFRIQSKGITDMWEMMKPQLMAVLMNAAKAMETRASGLEAQAGAMVPGQHTESRIVLYTRAGLWRDAAQMIRGGL